MFLVAGETACTYLFYNYIVLLFNLLNEYRKT